MDAKTIIKHVESKNDKGYIVFPTKAMEKWLCERGLRIVVELGTGKANIQH
jgi:hypothetical protein